MRTGNRFQTQLGKGAHLEFPGAYDGWFPRKNLAFAGFFRGRLSAMKTNVMLLLIASVILATVHIISLELFLYWRFFWIDIFTHALGGSVVALSVFAAHELGFPVSKRYLKLIPVLAFVLMVAFAWEVYELKIGIPIEDGYEVDTIVDLLMGLVGGFIGYVVGKRMQAF